MERRERSLEGGHTAVAAEFLVTGGEIEAEYADAELCGDVVRVVGNRIGAIVALAGVAGRGIQLDGIQGDVGTSENPVGLARESDPRVVVDQIGERLALNDGEIDPAIEQDEIAVEVFVRAVAAEHRSLRDRVGRVEGERADLRLAAHGIEGLLVLAPADVADEACIVENDPLASDDNAGTVLHI